MLRRAFIRFQLFILPILGYTMSAREATGVALLLVMTGGVFFVFSADILMTAICLLIMLGFIVINCMILHRSWLISELDAELHEESLGQQREALQQKLKRR